MNSRKLSTEMAKHYGVSVRQSSQRVLSPNDIGKILGVTGEAVKQWIYHRRLPAIKGVNGYWKVTVADFERFLAARQERRFAVFVEAADEIKKAISAAGYDVVSAQNLHDALLKLADRFPSMLVLDMKSPNIPALELLKQRNKINAMKKSPAVVIGPLSDSELDCALSLGVIAAAGDVNDVLLGIENGLGQRTPQRI